MNLRLIKSLSGSHSSPMYYLLIEYGTFIWFDVERLDNSFTMVLI